LLLKVMIVWGGVDDFARNSGAGLAFGFNEDNDGDGYSECDGDCNDLRADIAPGLAETCDGLDNNCNLQIDENAEPDEVEGVGFQSQFLLVWQPEATGLGAIHDVARGRIDELPVGSGVAETCFASVQGGSTPVFWPPPSRTGYWYLVRGRNDCGAGTYGDQSDGTERTTNVCP
jgi:hypothetical protein